MLLVCRECYFFWFVLTLLVCREYSDFGGCSCVTGLQRLFLFRWLFFCYWSTEIVLVSVVVLVLLVCREYSGFGGCFYVTGLLRVFLFRVCSYVTGLQRVFWLRWLFFCYWSAESVLVFVTVLVLLVCREFSCYGGCSCVTVLQRAFWF